MSRLAIKTYVYTIIVLCSMAALEVRSTISSLAKNDPYPFFSALDPHYFVSAKERMEYKDPEFAEQLKDHVTIAVSPFSQTAYRGRDMAAEAFIGTYTVELSDLEGRPNMLTLLYGPTPQNATLAPTLLNARNQIFPGVTGTIDDQTLIDPNQLFGCFSFPQKYTKRGARFDVQAHLGAGFGLWLQTGYVALSQIREKTLDLNCFATNACPFVLNTGTQALVNQYLMEELDDIAQEIGYSLKDYNKHGWEEVRMSLFWSHAYELNPERYNWPQVLAVPFFEVTGSINPSQGLETVPLTPLFGAPIGNNKHNAVGFSTGINFDFIETIEIGIEGGITHFFKRDIEQMHIPNNEFQTGIFPFRTDVTVRPGMNWHFGAKLAAYHFLDRLSMHFQYMIIEHKQDCIQLKQADPAFLPQVLAERTQWRTHLADIGFTYDICPNGGLGFEWQAPIYQRNTYRSSTVLFSVYGTF